VALAKSMNRRVKAAIIFFFLVLNGTWILIALLLHVNRVDLPVSVGVVVFGAALGNLVLYFGVRLGLRLARKMQGNSNENLN
jgi:membrane protein DedA with SNARE-associated domain